MRSARSTSCPTSPLSCAASYLGHPGAPTTQIAHLILAPDVTPSSTAAPRPAASCPCNSAGVAACLTTSPPCANNSLATSMTFRVDVADAALKRVDLA